MKKLLLFALVIPAIFGINGQSTITKPTTVSIVSASGTSSAWARTGGDVFTVSNSSAWSINKNCVYYGYPNSILGVISGNCGTKQDLTYNSGLSSLSSGILFYTGSTTYSWLTGTFTVNVRLKITITDVSGTALPITNNGTINYIKITQNFKVKYELMSQNPFTGNYEGSINVYDYPNSSNGSGICTSLTHDDKFYGVTTTAGIGFTGAACVGNTLTLNAIGGISPTSYNWQLTGSGSTFPNTASITYNPTTATNKRFKVTVTGAAGCIDTNATVIKMKDTAVEVDLKGNNLGIASGSVTPSIANGTDFGSVVLLTPNSHNFKIFNYGNQPIVIGSGSVSSPFSITGLSGTHTIAGHDSLTFNVVFTPSSLGIFTSTVSFATEDCDESNYTFTVTGVGGVCDTTREIDIRGNNSPITSGSTGTSTANFTDFGNIIENATVSKTFKVYNLKTNNLILTNLTLTGGTASEFSLSGITFPATILPGDSGSFVVTCAPTSLGVKTTTVTVLNNDCDEFSYNFVIKATDICNTAREINIDGNGIAIAKGTTSTTGSNNTDYGSTILGGSLIGTFNISNPGTAALNLTSINISGADPSMFVLSGIAMPMTLPGGSTTSFVITFSPTTAGVKTATITVNSNDCDEASYDFAVKGASSSSSVIKITLPTGTSITPATTDTRAWAMGSGSYSTIRNANWKTYTECHYWGYRDTIPGVINGYNASSTCSGLNNLFYSAGQSSLSTGKLVYTGNTNYYYLNSSGFFVLTSVPVRLTFNIKDTLGNALPLVRSGSISLLKISKNFRVYLFLESLAPTNGFGYGGGSYVGAIDLFNVLHTDPSSLICTSINLDQFYSVTTTASATNFGPYCSNTPLHIKATGGLSYKWSGPNSFAAYSNDTTFNGTGFTDSARFKVEATGVLGCKDSAITYVNVRDTGTKITVTGNGNAIADGSTVTSASNGTNLGGVAVGGALVQAYTISNSGTKSLKINSINITGPNASMFAASGITLPYTVSAGGTKSFNITYTPSSIGTNTATVTLNNNSCLASVYDFAIEGNTTKCDSTSPLARTPGLHKAAIVQTSPGGWTCYCDAAGKLLLSLKLGGTGAIIPDTGVSLKIASTLAVHHHQNTGFIKSQYGFSVWNRTWDIKPNTQPTGKVPVRYFFHQDMVDSINQSLTGIGLQALPNNDSIYFWKVTNNSLGAHPAIASINTSDIKLIQGGKGTVSDTTWTLGAFGVNEYAQFLVSGFSGGGGGGGSAGGTPLPVEIVKITGSQQGRTVVLNWYVEENNKVAVFNILRSEDGVFFDKIGEVTANTNFKNNCAYSFIDNKIGNDGKYFYRIVQLNLNTTKINSNIIRINFNQPNINKIAVWPNPFNTEFNLLIDNANNEQCSVEIFDMNGKLRAVKKTNSKLVNLNLAQFSTGVYQVMVRDNAGALIGETKLIKQ